MSERGASSPLRLVPSAAGFLLPFALHAAAREVDSATGLLLHTTLDLPAFPLHALALVEGGRLAGEVAAATAAGAVLWIIAAAWRRAPSQSWPEALHAVSGVSWPLLLRPFFSVLALLSLAVEPTYPYGFTLPVSLTQDWAIAQDLLAAAALIALHLRGDGGDSRAPATPPRSRTGGPRGQALAVGTAAFLAYAFLAPEWSRTWEGHPGNEPKTLRMAVALGHWLTLDTEPVSAGMEALPTGALAAVPDRATFLTRETGRLLAGLGQGPAGVDASAIRATRITRQTIAGKDGGVYHVLAPGPSALLAPALRLDRAWNLARGTPGRLRVTLVFWQMLAAWLVAALFLLLREATGRAGLSAALSGFFALTPPFSFYSFQFYPEMLGALAFAVLLRALLFLPWWSTGRALSLGLLLATLPWLHQKFLPLWAVVTLAMLGTLVSQMAPLRTVLGLLVPQALTLFAFALYNFAITGSVRPDALFLAWGPRGVNSARLGQGLLGLLLDARFGIVPYVPLYLLAGAGLLMRGRAARRLRYALPIAVVYYVTVAAADNWSGAVCNLGRYVMPVAPYLIALLAVALAGVRACRGVVATLLALAGWSALLAWALFRDPHAANDSALLLAQSAYADGNVYLPNLFLRTWSDAAPGLLARVLVWLALFGWGGLWLLRAARGRGGRQVAAATCGLLAGVLSLALLLERWPSPRTAASFSNRVDAAAGTAVFVSGAAHRDRDGIVGRSGRLDLLVRAPAPLAAIRVTVHGGNGTLRWAGRTKVPVPAHGLVADVPLRLLGTWTGRRGVSESLMTSALTLEADAPARLSFLTLQDAAAPLR